MTAASFAEPVVESDARKSSSKVAIVDDNREMCSIISKMIEHFGWNAPVVMHEGEEIVNAVKNYKLSPDVIIMDYRLPHMNGIEASRAISRKFPRIKIIVVTSDESVESEAVSEGFGFLKKPFNFRSFAQSVFS